MGKLSVYPCHHIQHNLIYVEDYDLEKESKEAIFRSISILNSYSICVVPCYLRTYQYQYRNKVHYYSTEIQYNTTTEQKYSTTLLQYRTEIQYNTTTVQKYSTTLPQY